MEARREGSGVVLTRPRSPLHPARAPASHPREREVEQLCKELHGMSERMDRRIALETIPKSMR